THAQILFRRSPPQKGLTRHITRFHVIRGSPPLSRNLRQCADFDSRLQSQYSAVQRTTRADKPKNLVIQRASSQKSLSFRRASSASKEESASSPTPPSRHTTPIDGCRRFFHCTPASPNEKRPAVHAGLQTANISPYCASTGCHAPGAQPTLATCVVSAELALTLNASKELATPFEAATTKRYFPLGSNCPFAPLAVIPETAVSAPVDKSSWKPSIVPLPVLLGKSKE